MAGRAAPRALSLCDLPDSLLARVLAWLPCDDQARAAVLSRRFAALLSTDAACRERVSFDCSRVVLHDDTRAALLRRAGAHLRGLDLGPPHPAQTEQRLRDALDLLSEAQRAELTTLRCSRRPWEPRARRAEHVSAVLDALARCPKLTLLAVDVQLYLHAQPHEEVGALLRSLPRLRVGRLLLSISTGSLAAYPPATLAALCGCCAELCYVSVEAADVALIEALPAGGAGGGPTLSVRLGVHEETQAAGVAALLRLAQRPGVTALALDRPSAATTATLVDALCAPGCSVRALAFHNFRLDAAFVDAMERLLRAGFPLRRLALHEFRFEFHPVLQHAAEEKHGQFTRLCAALAKWGRALEELSIRSDSVVAADAPSLALLLRAMRSLRSLDVSDCSLEPAGVAALGTALSAPHATLQRLRISNVRGSANGSTVGVDALAAMLRANTSLRELHALGFSPAFEFGEDSEWTARDGDVLLDALAHNTTLRAATLPSGLYEDEEGVHNLNGLHTRELRVLALHAEHPRAAEVAFRANNMRAWEDGMA
jgi:hypothetical protein